MEIRVRFLFVADDGDGDAVHDFLVRESRARGGKQLLTRRGAHHHELCDCSQGGGSGGNLFTSGIRERLHRPAFFTARGRMLRKTRQRRQQREEQGSEQRFLHSSSLAAMRPSPPAASNPQLFESQDVRSATGPSGFVPVSCWICAANCAAATESPRDCASAKPACAAAMAAAVLAG